jgi:Fe-S cluster assembly protein SufD
MTTTELAPSTGFDVAWAERAAKDAGARGETAWAAELRRAAAATLRGLEFPRRDEELWRRTDFGTLNQAIPGLDPFVVPRTTENFDQLPEALIDRLGEDALCANAVVQIDGGVAAERVSEALSSRGIVVSSLERAMREHPERVRAAYGSMLADDFDWYAALGAALRTGGAFVYVPDGVEAHEPIRIIHHLTKSGVLTTPRSVVVLGRGARAIVIEEQWSQTTEGVSFHAGGIEVFLGDESKLICASLQDWGRNVYHYSNQRVRIGRDAELQWVQTLLGSRMAKVNAYYDLAGPGARAYVHGFMFGDKRQHFHLHTLQRHLVENTTSDLLIKGCLKDRARSIYQGLIQVSEGAQRTDAYQANRNLLLSDTARADSIPGLEILANDVRCTHGATIGNVDDEQMYYLMSRGLQRTDAQRLIVEGFFAPVLDRIPLDDVREHLRAEIEHKIG